MSREIFDHLRKADAPGSARLFPNALLEAGDGLGGDPPTRFSFASEAESEKLPLPRPSHGALRLVDLELETVCEEVCNTLHHSLARSFAVDIDVAIVGIAYKVVTAPLQLSVQFVQHQIAEQRRKRTALRRALIHRAHQSILHHTGLQERSNQLEHSLVGHARSHCR